MRVASVAQQPLLGFAGLLLVVPTAVPLALGVGGAEPSLLVLGPLITFALPVIAMIAFWWENWPGTRLGPSIAGWANTLLVIAAAVPLAVLGQAVVGEVDLRGIFDPNPGPGHDPTFPATMPLAGAVFVAMLQLTLVCEGRPLHAFKPFTSGVVALVLSWAIALAVYGTGLDGGFLIVIGAWQVWFFVAWRGWPFTLLQAVWLRLLVANVVIIGGGWLTYEAVLRLGSVDPATISAAAGSFVAAALLIAMLFDSQRRAATLAGIVLLAAALYLPLRAYAEHVEWQRASADEWVAHVGLNAIGVAVILHVGIGRRWPFARD